MRIDIRSRRGITRGLAIVFLLMTCTIGLSQATKISAPKNRYSVADDVKLGKEAAAQVVRELPLLPENGEVDSYIERIGLSLAGSIPDEFRHSEFQYDFSVVNAKDINAFALPGGPMFVNRGMIESARSEGEMAGVMAHEISHVALRHGTAQATKTQAPGVQLGALGGAILGAVIGGNAGDILAQGTQLGLGAYLLKYSREYETQADILGAQILARAGYDPMDLARMFQTIEQQGGSQGPEWLSSHPNPGNRYERISQEAQKLNSIPRNTNQAEFTRTQSSLRRMAPAPTMEEAMRSAGAGSEAGRPYPDDARVQSEVEPPATRYRAYEAPRVVRMSVPVNWQEFSDQSSVTFAPKGAYGVHDGQSVFTHGAIVGVVNSNSTNLTTATDEYVSNLLRNNAYLRADRNYQQTTINKRQALLRRLVGTSNVTGRKEVVNVYTTLLNNGPLLYVIQVVPEEESQKYARAFNDMVRSLRLLN
ncbi:MAG TPA: M48 family metallopeptidase [Terriglobia bacterium]|nr:M48 family metallopeptidase [Terriglobia bacterium]